MEDKSCSPSSSTPVPAAFQALNEKEGTEIPSPIINSSLSRSNERAIAFGDELSLKTCRGSKEEMEETAEDGKSPTDPK